MKKVLFFSVSIFGISNIANAWSVKTPQSWTVGGGKTIVHCENTSTQNCLSGEGASPQVGQQCEIWHYGRVIGTGTVIRVGKKESAPPGDNNYEVEVVAETDVQIPEV